MLEGDNDNYMAYGVALAIFRIRNVLYEDDNNERDEHYLVLVGYLTGSVIFNIVYYANRKQILAGSSFQAV